MDASQRREKKIREAAQLRGLSPQVTIDMGSDITAFGLELAERARLAKH